MTPFLCTEDGPIERTAPPQQAHKFGAIFWDTLTFYSKSRAVGNAIIVVCQNLNVFVKNDIQSCLGLHFSRYLLLVIRLHMAPFYCPIDVAGGDLGFRLSSASSRSGLLQDPLRSQPHALHSN